jgi:streptogramin lyase
VRRLFLTAVVLAALQLSSASASGPMGPVSLAVGYGSVWVGYGDGRIVRVDPESRRLSTVVRPLITGFVASMATGFGSVWAVRHDGTLVRLDGRTGRVRASILGRWGDIAVGAGYVWVTSGERVLVRIDPRTNTVTGRRRVPGRLWGDLAAGRRRVWFQTIPSLGPATGPAGPRMVWRLHPRTLALSRVMRMSCDARFAVAGVLWALDTCAGTVQRPGRPPVEVARGGNDLTIGAGALWIAEGLTVHRVDTGRRVVAARIPADGESIRTSRDAIWLLDMGDGVVGWLRRIDPRTNRIAGRPIRLSARQ